MIEPTYRVLPAGEWPRIRAKFEEQGYDLATVPNSAMSRAAVCEVDGRIVSFLFLQLVPHAEPIHIDDDQRGKVSWLRMLHMVEGLMPPGSEYFVLAPDKKVETMCDLADMTDTGWKVYKKAVR